MERRHQTIENSDLPKPWEDNPLTRAGWERHKDLLLSGAATGYGWRPNGWWMYERNMAPPSAQDQARKLYEMGELKGVELERCLVSWPDDLEPRSHRPYSADHPPHSRGVA